MKKVLGTIFLVVYAVVAIAITILLLSYNEYMCSEIGGYTLYKVEDNSLEPNFVRGDLIIINHVGHDTLNVGEKVFLYQNLTSNDFLVKYGELTDITQQGSRTVYTIDNQFQFDSTYLIGRENGSKVVHKLGTVLSIVESRWGYLFCIVIVTLLIFLEEVYELVMEIKYGNEQETAKSRG